MRMGKIVPRSMWTIAALWLPLAVGCGGDEPGGGSPKVVELGYQLDCTGVEGGPAPEEIPGGEEVYYPGAIKEHLEKYDVLRERYGGDEVTNCEQARRFWKIYQEEHDSIVEQYLEENPPFSTDDPIDLSDIDTSDEPGPPDEGEATGADAAADIQKIHLGYAWEFSPVLQINVLPTPDATEAEACSATAISPRWMLTAAHCVPGDSDWYVTAIYKQQGTSSVLQFKGALWMWYEKAPAVSKTDVANDLALATFWQDEQFSSYSRIWLSDNVKGEVQYSLGYGEHFRSDPDWTLHWGLNTVTSKTYTDWYALDPYDGNKNVGCFGDSGGPSGDWHNGAFAIHGVIGVGPCGSLGYWTTHHNRPAYHSNWIASMVGNCKYVRVTGGTVMQCW